VGRAREGVPRNKFQVESVGEFSRRSFGGKVKAKVEVEL